MPAQILEIPPSSAVDTGLDIVARIRSGDQYAFRDLFERYYQVLVNLAFRYVRDGRVAEDIVEEVFLNIWENRIEWNLTISLKAYLYKSIRNRSFNHLKRSEKFSAATEQEMEELVEDPRTPAEELSEQEAVAEIQMVIDELPERSREVFIMAKYDGLKYAEIAAILGIGVGTVETHMVRSLKFLRLRLRHLAVDALT